MDDKRNSLSALFKRNVRDAIDASSFKSERAAAIAAGIKPTQLHNFLNMEQKNGPGLFAVAELSAALGVSVSSLLGMNESGRPSSEALVKEWDRSHQTLSGLDWAMDFLQIYEIPEPNGSSLKMIHLGPLSLGAQASGIKSLIVFQAAMNAFAQIKKPVALIREFSRMASEDITTSIGDLKVPKLRGLSQPVSIRHQRLNLACTDDDGKRVVASLNTPI